MDDDKILEMPLESVFILFIIELNEVEDAVGIIKHVAKVFGFSMTPEKTDDLLTALYKEKLITESPFHRKHYKVSWHGKELLPRLHNAFNQYGLVCKRALAQKTGRCVE